MRKLSRHRGKRENKGEASLSRAMPRVWAERTTSSGPPSDSRSHVERLRAEWNGDAPSFVPATFDRAASAFTPSYGPGILPLGAPRQAEVRAGGRVVVHIAGLRTVSEQNQREHWRTLAKRKKHQKRIVTVVLSSSDANKMMALAPLMVTMTRLSPGPGLDSDNMVASQKHVRDAVAKAMGVDDGDARVTWVVQQKKGPWAVEIRIEEAKA